MATINGMYERVAKLDLREQVPAIIENTAEEIIALNQEQLYLSGINREGEELREYRNENYARAKNSMNPNPGLGVPDLNLTGDFYRGFKLQMEADGFSIDSTDQKTGMLKDKYGETIFGLTPDSRIRYAFGAFFDAVKNYIQNITGLQFKSQ